MREFVFAAVLVLTACGAPPGGAAQSSDAAVSAAAPTSGAPAAIPQVEGKPEAPVQQDAALVGRWGDNGDCGKDIVFRGDGTFHSYTGGEGRWSLNGDQLTMAGEGGTFGVVIRWTDQNSMQVINPDGTVGISHRC
jgi:hypothetical protein